MWTTRDAEILRMFLTMRSLLLSRKSSNPENGIGNCEEREGRASLDGRYQSTPEDLPHPSGCARKPPEDEAQGLE
jgi:hypothetical protein